MPENYNPANNGGMSLVVPIDDEPADGPRAFRDFADSLPILPVADEPIQVVNHSADFVFGSSDLARLHVVDTSGGSAIVWVPLDDGTIVVGSAIAIANIGTDEAAIVQVKPTAGVTVQNKALLQIPQFATAMLTKVGTNAWIIVTGGVPGADTSGNISATGGTESTFVGDGVVGEVGKTYKRHTFLADGNFVVSSAGKAHFTLLAGGGGCGTANTSEMMGAGGAGGLLNEEFSIEVGTHVVRVGGGGIVGNNGGPTSVGPYSAVGGGCGGQNRNRAGGDGGSGGGGGDGTGIGGRGVPGQGYDGGNGGGNPDAGGGGGASGAGVGPVGGPGVTMWGVALAKGGSVTTTAAAAPVANSGNGGGINNGGSGVAGSSGRAEIWYEV